MRLFCCQVSQSFLREKVESVVDKHPIKFDMFFFYKIEFLVRGKDKIFISLSNIKL